MKVQLYKHEDGLAFQLPQELVDQLGIKEGDDLTMVIVRQDPPEIEISKTQESSEP